WFPADTKRDRRIECCDHHLRARGGHAAWHRGRAELLPSWSFLPDRQGKSSTRGSQGFFSIRNVVFTILKPKLRGSGQSQLDFEGSAQHLPQQNVHFLNAGR